MKFKSDIEVQAGLKDSSGNAGTSGQVLSTAGTSVSWVDASTLPAQSSQNLITEVWNETGSTLTKGTIVYINNGHGNLPTITKALANAESTSSQTYGIVRADITNNNNGWVVVVGSLTNLDTQSYTPGTVLYLSSTTAGAWTSTKQYAPAHLVYVGIVVRSHPTQGIVEVKIQNGYELDELHNVSAQAPANNNGIFYNTATSLWETKSIPTALGYTPADNALTISTTAPLQGGGDLSANRTLSITQAGASSNGYLSSTDWNTFNSKQVAMSFNSPLIYSLGTLSINQATTSSNGYLSSTDWNTFNSKIGGSGTTNYLPKFTSSGTIGNSLIYDNGTNVGIGTTSPDNGKLTILKNTSNATESSYGIAIQSNASNAYTELLLGADDTVDCGVIQTAGKNTSFTTKKLALQPQGGNVGIGTTAPSAKLEVNGSSLLGGSLNSDWAVGVNNTGSTNANGLYVNIGASSTGVPFAVYKNFSAFLLVNNSGNVGIGTTSPSAKLDVLGDIRNINSDFLSYNSANNTYSRYGFNSYYPSGGFNITNDGAFPLTFGTNATERIRITSGGNVIIGTTTDVGYKFQVNGGQYGTYLKGGDYGTGSNILLLVDAGGNVKYQARGDGLHFFTGNVSVTGTVTASGGFFNSDIRLKNLTDYDYNISDIKPITYLWKDSRDNKKHIGYSAQEVQKVMPDAVNEGEDGMLSVNYVEVLVAKIEAMEKEIAYLKSKI